MEEHEIISTYSIMRNFPTFFCPKPLTHNDEPGSWYYSIKVVSMKFMLKKGVKRWKMKGVEKNIEQNPYIYFILYHVV